MYITPTFETGNPLVEFIFILFNGISEVPLVSSVVSGALILIGVLIASRRAAAMMVAGSLIGAGMGLLLGVPYHLITAGLLGYNSVLSAMAIWSGPFTKTNGATLVLSLFNAAMTVVIYLALDNVFENMFEVGGGGYGVPSFTLGFCVATWMTLLAARYFGIDIFPRTPSPEGAISADGRYHDTVATGVTKLLPNSGNPDNSEDFHWTAWELIKAAFTGVAQITFINNWKTGVFWVIGLTLSFSLVSGGIFNNAYTANWDPLSPLFLAGIMAFLGSLIGAVFAKLVKFPDSEIRSGLHGFNQALLMIALTSFLPLNLTTFLYAVFATIVCTVIIVPAVKNFLGRWGLPGLTGPFNFAAFFFIWAAPYILNIAFGLGWGRP